MFARRLSRWLGRVFSAAVSALRSDRARQTEPVVVVAGPAERSSNISSSSAPRSSRDSAYDARSESWINDGKRLRPSAPTRSESFQPPAASATVEPVPPMEPPRRASITRPVPAHDVAAEASEVPYARLLSLAASGRDPRAADLELEGLSAVERRLVLLRYLVRQRVYNEGFSRERTPEQYHRSLGLGDTDRADGK